MPPTTRHRGASPDAQTLAGLREPAATAGRLQKAPAGDPVLAAASPAARPDATPSGGGAAKPAPAPAKAKVGYYQDAGDIARARAAYDWTRLHEGHRSFSDFIAAAVMREVERVEGRYHDGQPWPSLKPGELPTGKPLGS